MRPFLPVPAAVLPFQSPLSLVYAVVSPDNPCFSPLASFVNFSMAIVGGLLSDRALGQYGTVIVGTMCNIVGAGLLVFTTVFGLSSLTTLRVITGLAMLGVAMGNGISATVLSTYIGTQYRGDPKDLPSVYRWFYITFNTGVVFASLGTPVLTSYASPSDAFIVLWACAFMALAVFLAGTSLYRSSTLVTVAVTPSPAPKKWTPKPSPRFSLAAWRERKCCRVPKVTPRQRRKLLAVLKVYAPFTVFWALFFNIYGLWTFTAVGMNRKVGSYEVPAGQVTALNPLIDIFLIPIFDVVVYVRWMCVWVCGWVCVCGSVFLCVCAPVVSLTHRISTRLCLTGTRRLSG